MKRKNIKKHQLSQSNRLVIDTLGSGYELYSETNKGKITIIAYSGQFEKVEDIFNKIINEKTKE